MHGQQVMHMDIHKSDLVAYQKSVSAKCPDLSETRSMTEILKFMIAEQLSAKRYLETPDVPHVIGKRALLPRASSRF